MSRTNYLVRRRRKKWDAVFKSTVDFKMFEEMLNNPPEPNEALKQAHERYKQKLAELKTN